MAKKFANKMILDDLRKKIASGEYAVGDKLPNERDLADHYGVSRVPVREALNQLVEDGVIIKKHGNGNFVQSTAGTVRSGDKEGIFLDNDEIMLETIRVRILIESDAAAGAARNSTPEQREQLGAACLESIRELRKLKDGQENHFVESDQKFHLMIAESSGNPVYAECLKAMSGIISEHVYWSLRMTAPLDEAIPFHSTILEYILMHDEDGARNTMKAHLSRTEELLRRKNMSDEVSDIHITAPQYSTKE